MNFSFYYYTYIYVFYINILQYWLYNYYINRGKFIATSFHEIPDEDDFPEYYDNMKEDDMLSIKIIRRKLNQNNYNSFKEFKKDFETMVHDIVKYRSKKEPEIDKEGNELLVSFNKLIDKIKCLFEIIDN